LRGIFLICIEFSHSYLAVNVLPSGGNVRELVANVLCLA